MFDGLNLPLFTYKKDKLVRIPAFINGLFLQGLFRQLVPQCAKESAIVNLVANRLQYIRLSRFYRPKKENTKIWVERKIELEIKYLKEMAQRKNIQIIFVQTPYQKYFSKTQNLEDYHTISRLFISVPHYVDANIEIERYTRDLWQKENKDLSLIEKSLKEALKVGKHIDEFLFFSEDEEPNKMLRFGERHLNPMGYWVYAKAVEKEMLKLLNETLKSEK